MGKIAGLSQISSPHYPATSDDSISGLKKTRADHLSHSPVSKSEFLGNSLKLDKITRLSMKWQRDIHLAKCTYLLCHLPKNLYDF